MVGAHLGDMVGEALHDGDPDDICTAPPREAVVLGFHGHDSGGECCSGGAGTARRMNRDTGTVNSIPHEDHEVQRRQRTR